MSRLSMLVSVALGLAAPTTVAAPDEACDPRVPNVMPRRPTVGLAHQAWVPSVDPEVCPAAQMGTLSQSGSAWVITRADGPSCEVWLGGETRTSENNGVPSQYCRVCRGTGKVPVDIDVDAGTARISADSCLDRSEPPPPPPRQVKQCPPQTSPERECMCDAECVRRGFASCQLPAGSPLCGGQCSTSAPRRPTLCGRGADRYLLEAFPHVAKEGRPAARVSQGALSIERYAFDGGLPLGACGASCAAFEQRGPLVDLAPSSPDSLEGAVVISAGGSWYVAWGGQRDQVGLLQRFTADGAIAGPTMRIDGVTPFHFVWSEANGGELVLVSWVDQASTPGGITQAVHRFSPALEPRGAPWLVRGPDRAIGPHTVVTSSGVLVSTIRARDFIREISIPLAASPGEVASIRDLPVRAPPTYFDFLEWNGDYVTPALGGGTVVLRSSGFARPGRVTDISMAGVKASTRSWVFLAKQGDSLWALALSGQPGASSALMELRGTPLKASRPLEFAHVDQDTSTLTSFAGTLFMSGSSSVFGAQKSPSLVPFDQKQKAWCPATAFRLGESTDSHEAFLGSYAKGDELGVALLVWGREGKSRLFFTRVGCKH